jgi:hypothetical protein
MGRALNDKCAGKDECSDHGNSPHVLVVGRRLCLAAAYCNKTETLS